MNVLILFQLDGENHLFLAKKVGSHSVLEENKKRIYTLIRTIKNNSSMELFLEYQGDKNFIRKRFDLAFDLKIVDE